MIERYEEGMLGHELHGWCVDAQAEIDALRKDAERYRWLRDKGSATWMPFTRQWDMNAEHCDAAIDNEMATHGLFGAA